MAGAVVEQKTFAGLDKYRVGSLPFGILSTCAHMAVGNRNCPEFGVHGLGVIAPKQKLVIEA